MNKILITIGREKGSGGHSIGKLLAERLGIPCYDKERLVQMAMASDFPERFAKEFKGKESSQLLHSLAANITTSAYSHPLHQQVFRAQSNLIQSLAEKESGIFVGRCADYILRKRTDVLNLFIHAPISDRIDRLAQHENTTVAEAEKLVLQTDRNRAAYYTHFTNNMWGAAKNYHLSFDSSKITVQGIVKTILSL